MARDGLRDWDVGNFLAATSGSARGGLEETPVGIVTLFTALIAILMVLFCGRRWKKEYSAPGKTRSPLVISSGIVAVYHGMLIAWF